MGEMCGFGGFLLWMVTTATRYAARRCKNAFTKAEAVFKKVVPP